MGRGAKRDVNVVENKCTFTVLEQTQEGKPEMSTEGWS